MNNNLISFDDFVSELIEFTDLNEVEVKEMVWREVFDPGCNVKQEALNFGIDFHVYNEKMENFYKNSNGFIIETSVESLRKGKRTVLKTIKKRVANFLAEHNQNRINILMMGDGVGNDTRFLYHHFNSVANFFYFDVPGSKTYNFAKMNLKKHGVKVQFISAYEDIPHGFFDLILCLEVLEHLPDPESSVDGLKNFLKIEGIVIVTESFGNVNANFPTHLKSNQKYQGKTPFMFLKNGLLLRYYSKDMSLMFRPMEFIKKEQISLKNKILLYFDGNVMIRYLYSILRC